MKIFAIIVCFFISINVLAQSTDTTRNYHLFAVKIANIDSFGTVKPLFVIDGVINKNLRINPNNILRVAVLMPPGSTDIYGKRGANGIILITTKLRQNIHTIKKGDTTVSKLPDSAVYVIDGEISTKKLVGVDPKDILSIDIIKQDVASEHFEGEARNGLVVVVTKNNAIKSYQEKLSTFSNDYKNYLIRHKNDDSDLIYVLGYKKHSVNGPPRELTKELYQLPLEKIKKVAFLDRNKYSGINHSVVIVITKK